MDTLAISRRLREAGLEQPVADGQWRRLETKIDETFARLERRLIWRIIGAGGLYALLQIAASVILPN